jgi:hypothetical protein
MCMRLFWGVPSRASQHSAIKTTYREVLTFKQKGRHAKHGGPFYFVVWLIVTLALTRIQPK